MATTRSRPASLDLPGLVYRRDEPTHIRRAATISSLLPNIDPGPTDSSSSFSNSKPLATKSSHNDDPPGPDLEGQTVESKLEEQHPEAPYHVFSRREKWHTVWIVSLAGLFSPLSSNIYFPALGAISLHTKTSLAALSLTVTAYMAVQGLAPSFWGPLSDLKGRRVTFMGTFVVYLAANVGLALSGKSFAGLMAFRAVQAFGGAATISVGAGVISDITTPKERGGFLGSFGGIRMLGQSVGPVMGGIITEFFGFQAIFWFLVVLGSVSLILIVLFLPETLRSIAGDGSIPLKGINRPLVSTRIRKHWTRQNREDVGGRKEKLTMGAILSPLGFLFEKDVFVTLFFGAAVYAIWSMVTSSTAALFQSRFNLSNLQVGLVFLPNGAACVSGSYFTGKLLDGDYRIAEDAYRKSHNLSASTRLDSKRLAEFPITRARLRSSWYLIPLFICSVTGYGFSITSSSESKRGMILPLVLQFVIAFTATAVFTQNSALMVDLYPGASASATAVNNLIRCGLGAVGVAGVQAFVDGVGAGMAFGVLGGVVLGVSPLMGVMWAWGEGWREERVRRMGREEDE